MCNVSCYHLSLLLVPFLASSLREYSVNFLYSLQVLARYDDMFV